jgi:hypothetical protein
MAGRALPTTALDENDALLQAIGSIWEIETPIV